MICNLVFGVDNKYVYPLVTTLNSLFLSSPNNTFNIFILSLDIVQKNKEHISNWIHQKGHQIHYIDINENTLQNFPLKENETISKATYLRLLIPELIPHEITKILYLDSDIIINNEIHELYNTDIDNFALAAVEDAPNNSIIAQDIYPSPYFNAGVLLLNLQFLRDINFTQLAIKYIHENATKIQFHDQDVLNAILHNSVLFLPLQWNLLDCYFQAVPKIQTTRQSELSLAKEHPAIIHFSGAIKPWHAGCFHPYINLYIRNKPKIKLQSKISKWERLNEFPRYQRVLIILHCPLKLFRFIDILVFQIWKLFK